MRFAREAVDRLTFRVDVLVDDGGRRLQKAVPDENGYYDMPLAVLGIESQNQTYYKVDPFVAQITDPSSHFCKNLRDGKLYGEWMHPSIEGMAHEAAIMRLNNIDGHLVSHHFSSVYVGETLPNGGRLVNGKVRPFGPKEKPLADSLVSPLINTSFSLRAITQETIQGSLRLRTMRRLVTFDAVLAGGYREAAKRYRPSLELEIVPVGDDLLFTECSLESMTNSEINELLGSSKVTYQRKQVTVLRGGRAYVKDSDGLARSLYNAMLRQP